MAELKPASAINLDVFLKVLSYTVASPAFAALAVAFAYLFQKNTLLTNDFRNPSIYFGVCWMCWFLSWSSRVWESRSWRFGIAGLMGFHRIDWSDQVVVITGGRQGLGKAIVDILRIKGVSVAVLDRDVPSQDESEDGIYWYKCDVSDYNQVQEAAEKIAKDVGQPTILINNAGIVSGRSMLELSELDIRRTMEVNVMGPFWTVKAFLPNMLTNRAGHIVNISSLLGTLGVAGCTDYCASKFAVLGFHEALKAECRSRHADSFVKFSVVLPSHIRTTLFAGLKPFPPLSAFLLPMLEPHDVAHKIITMIEREEQGELPLPAMVGATWLWRGLPSYVTDLLRWLSAADDSMSAFHQRPNAK